MNAQLLQVKAKPINDDHWWIGFYICVRRRHYLLPVYDVCDADQPYFDERYPFDGTDKDGWFEIDPATICRPIGLKDGNGNVRWEHDVIRDGPRTYEIRWDPHRAIFYLFGLGPTWSIPERVPWRNLPAATDNTIDKPELVEEKS